MTTTPDGTTHDPRDYDSLQEGQRPPRVEVTTVATLREIATQLAGADAAARKYTDPYLAEHGAGLLAENRLHQLCRAFVATLDSGRREAITWGTHLVRLAQNDLDATGIQVERAHQVLAETQPRRDQARDIVDGVTPGHWQDTGATEILSATDLDALQEQTSRQRRRRVARNVLMGAAEVVMLFVLLQPVSELTLGFVPREFNDVLVLIPALLICTATIAAAHQAGKMAKNATRLPGPLLVRVAPVVAMVFVLLGIQVFTSFLRVAGADNTDPTSVLYLGLWLFVMLAISAVAARYAFQEHNPVRDELRAAHGAVLQVTAQLDTLTAQQRKLQAVVKERQDSLEDVTGQWRAEMDALDTEWEHLVAIYRDTLARLLADPSITTALEVAPVVKPDDPTRGQVGS